MKRIFKYELEVAGFQVVNIQSEAILSVQEQNEKIVVYALVDTDLPPNKYEFGIIGTGHPITFDINKFCFLGTVKMYGGGLMFHVFYRKLE
ncbi:DUF7352 domain-containing protein [Desulforamulus ruminis]|uniref:DUF7352 domain-containing protein n=1 Tax=Desulforamulus ruminis (strain ATCC 23193 / DSM 2154 / NCIMB 8452 / DL) TaxID=696281 RepID=F6DTY7_DESRL|nr:hypothetical protein [Desulforamulus ruminis]AEG59005.1 hypothetical protein Desru_0722 [Desulforamulus ruminis DSM 2154]